MRDKKQQLEAIAKKRAALEVKKMKLDNQLRTNLHRKRDNLQAVSLFNFQSVSLENQRYFRRREET